VTYVVLEVINVKPVSSQGNSAMGASEGYHASSMSMMTCPLPQQFTIVHCKSILIAANEMMKCSHVSW
jgi:hypothetical protein